MKRSGIYYILCMAALCCHTIAYGQDNRQLAYEKSVDFIKCKCIEIVYNVTLDCETNTSKSSISQYTKNHPRTRSLVQEIEKLKENKIETWSKDSIINLLGNDIFAPANRSIYPQLHTFSTNKSRNTNGTISKLKTSINNHLQNAIPSLPNPEPPVVADSSTRTTIATATATTTPNTPQHVVVQGKDILDNARNDESSFFSFQLNYVHLLLTALAIYLAWYWNRRFRKEYEEQIIELKNQLFNKADTNDVTQVGEELSALKNKLEEARKKRLAAQQTSTEKVEQVAQTVVASSFPMAVEKIIYLPSPNSDGSFHHTDTSSIFRPGVSMYKFRINPNNPAMATFSFHSDNNGLQKAIENPSKYIRPVCEEINTAPSGSKTITTTKLGVAHKKDEIWVVTTQDKAQLRYD